MIQFVEVNIIDFSRGVRKRAAEPFGERRDLPRSRPLRVYCHKSPPELTVSDETKVSARRQYYLFIPEALAPDVRVVHLSTPSQIEFFGVVRRRDRTLAPRRDTAWAHGGERSVWFDQDGSVVTSQSSARYVPSSSARSCQIAAKFRSSRTPIP